MRYAIVFVSLLGLALCAQAENRRIFQRSTFRCFRGKCVERQKSVKAYDAPKSQPKATESAPKPADKK